MAEALVRTTLTQEEERKPLDILGNEISAIFLDLLSRLTESGQRNYEMSSRRTILGFS